jgi:hypothetical protein
MAELETKEPVTFPEMRKEENDEYLVKDMGDYIEKKVSNDLFIRIKNTPRLNARKKGSAEINIIAKEGDKTFNDTIHLKSSMSITAFKLLEEAELMKDDELDFEAMSGLLEIFPKFILKIAQKASFELSESEFDSMDDLIKIGIFEVLFVHYEKNGELISKK